MFPLIIRHLLFSLSPPLYPLFPSEMPHTEPKFYLFTNIQFCRLRAVPLQSVESKLGRTGESKLAERETGERQEEEELHSLL